MVTEGGTVPRKRDRLSLKLNINVKSTETTPSEDDGQVPACGEGARMTSPPSPILADTASSHMVAENPAKKALIKDDSDLLQKTVGIAGLQNLGNTCYLNSVLQVLRFTPGFLQGLNALNSSNTAMSFVGFDTERGTPWALIKQLSLLYSQLEKRETRFERLRQQGSSMNCPSAGRPEALLTVIRKINPMFEGNLQHDAQELLHCILCLLEDSEKDLDSKQHDIKPSPKLCTILDFFGNNGKKKPKSKVSMKREKDGNDGEGDGAVKVARMKLDYNCSPTLKENGQIKTSDAENSLNYVNGFKEKGKSPVSLASGREQSSSSPTSNPTAIRNIDVTPVLNGTSTSRTPTPNSDDGSRKRCRSRKTDSYHLSPGTTPVSRDHCTLSGLADKKCSNDTDDFALSNGCGATPNGNLSNGLRKSRHTPPFECGMEKGGISCGINGTEHEQNEDFSNFCKKRKLSPDSGVPIIENNSDRISPKTDSGVVGNSRGKRLGMRGGVPRAQNNANDHVHGHISASTCETTSAQLYCGMNGTDIHVSEGTASKMYKTNTQACSNSPNTRSSPRKLTPEKCSSSVLGNGPMSKMSPVENQKLESDLDPPFIRSSPRKAANVDINCERVSDRCAGKEDTMSKLKDSQSPVNSEMSGNGSSMNNLSAHSSSSETRPATNSSEKTTVSGHTAHSLKDSPFTENDLKNAALSGIKQAHVKLEKCDHVVDSALNAVDVGVAMKRLKTPTSVKKGFIERLFQGTMMLRTKCLECEFARERLEVFHDVSVPVRQTDGALIENSTDSEGDSDGDDQVGSLSHLMSAFSEVELLEKDNKYFCDNCTRYVEAERSMHYDTLPDVLTLHLKRFSSGAGLFGRVSKINDHVPTPFILPCLRYKCPNPCFRRDHRYQLYAVITHAGLTISSGHYMAFVRVISPGPAMYALQQWARKQVSVDDLSSDADSEQEVFFKSESGLVDGPAAVTPDQVPLITDESQASLNNGTDVFCVPGFAGDATAQSVNNDNAKNAEVLPSDFSNYWLEFDDDYVGVLSHNDFLEKLARNSGFHASPYVLFYHRYDDCVDAM